jgi:hypothetical protein
VLGRGPLALGLLALARARVSARGAGEGNVGLGLHFSFPPGPKEAHSRAARSLPLDGNQRLRVDFGRTKTPAPFSPRNPSSFLPLFPPAPLSAHPRERARVSGDGRCGAFGATASPLAGARVHRKVSAPPSSGFTVVPRSGACERHGGGSRGLCPREVQGLAGSGRRAGVPCTPTVGGARRKTGKCFLDRRPFAV